eukprot:84942_1
MTLSQGVAVILLLGVCLCDVELTALNQQQLSRLPFGELEQFVYSNDRRSLLRKWNNTMNIDDYIYYKMLQIENEFIDYNMDQINTLQKEFGEMKQLVNKTYSTEHKIPSKIKDLIFRNQFREIYDYNNFDKQTIHEFLDTLQTKLGLFFDYHKPKDHSQRLNINENNHTENASYIQQQTLFDKLNESFNYNFEEGYYKSILIEWILNNQYDKLLNDTNKIKHLFKHHQSKIIMNPEIVKKLIIKLMETK